MKLEAETEKSRLRNAWRNKDGFSPTVSGGQGTALWAPRTVVGAWEELRKPSYQVSKVCILVAKHGSSDLLSTHRKGKEREWKNREVK